jgi:hypothetical protein
MMGFIKWVGRLALILLIIGGPISLARYKEDFLNSTQQFELLRTYLTTTAFVGALWAIYLKDARLRSRSEYVLISLFLFVVIMAIATIGATLRAIDEQATKRYANYFGYLALVLYVISLSSLVITVFVQSYNEVYNLRTNKFYKYFRPFRWLRNKFAKDEHYELSAETRTYDAEKCPLMSNLFATPTGRERTSTENGCYTLDKERIKKGASILLTGTISSGVLDEITKWVLQRLQANETANYVACDRHPISIWESLKDHGIENPKAGHALRDSLVMVDVFTPAFGFTDEIHEDRYRQLSAQGVACVRAKTFAGLHTAVHQAFKIIKKKEKEQKGKQVRRPQVMVYDRTSALSDTESIEQFRVFWRHVIPSERSYGMITIIIEDEAAGDGVINPLKDLVDFVLTYDVADGKYKRTK